MVDFRKISKLHTSIRQHLTRYYLDELTELAELDAEVVAAYLVGMNRARLPFSGFPSTQAAIAATQSEIRALRQRKVAPHHGRA